MMAYPIVEKPPTTFNELANNAHHFQISLQFVHGTAYILPKTSPNPTLKAIFDRMVLQEDSLKCFSDLMGPDGAHRSCVSWVDVSIEGQQRNRSATVKGDK